MWRTYYSATGTSDSLGDVAEMSVLAAVDIRLLQSHRGSVMNSGYTFQTNTVPMDIVQLAAVLDFMVDNLLPIVNSMQHAGVQNLEMTAQARGTTTPYLTQIVGGVGTGLGASTTYMPPEFAYWLRFFPATTYESELGAEDLVHPIKRGGVFLPGVSDENLDDGVFDPDAAWTPNFDDFKAFMTTIHAIPPGYGLRGAILGEGIGPSLFWRIAEITDVKAVRVTRLRSRLAATG